MKISKYLPHPLVCGSFLLVFVYYYFNAPALFNCPDSAWHIATGDLMRAQNSILISDIWSYTSGDTKWYNLSWLWDLYLSVLHQFFGLKGLYIISCFSYAAVLAGLCHCLLSRGTYKDYAIFTIVFICMFTLWDFVNARPQLISFLLIVVFSHLLYKTREKFPKYYFVLLPALTAVWVNIHGGFLVGFTIIGAYFLEAYINKNNQWAKQLFTLGLLCGAAIFINPYGWEVVIGVMRTLHSVMTGYIMEWSPLVFGRYLGSSLCLMVFLLVSNPADKKIFLADKILTFAWLLGGMLSIRNFGIFIIVAAPYLAHCLGNVGSPKPFPDFNAANLRLRSFLFVAITTALMSTPYVSAFLLTRENLILDKNTVSVASIDYIKTNYPEKRFLNDYGLGGYLIYYSKGQVKVFVDGRAGTAYSEEVLSDYIKFFTGESNWEKIIAKYNIDGIVASNNNTFVKKYDQGLYRDTWTRVFADEAVNIFIKR